ncbi:MAG: sulfotransferase [Actinomycetota bacterium]
MTSASPPVVPLAAADDTFGGTPLKVLFIGGLGRSGSTLVELLLNELAETASVGETIHLWERGVVNNERCACGEAFHDCPHWTAVGQRAFGGWAAVDVDELIRLRWRIDRSRRLPAIARRHLSGPLGTTLDDGERHYLRHLRLVLQASAEVAGHPSVLLESSKHLSTAALLALDPAIDLRVLHLVRDPRGVAHSWTKTVERPETATADGAEMMPRYRPSRTAFRWMTDNLGFEALAWVAPTLLLRYEDALSHPTQTMRDVADLCGLDRDRLDLGFIAGNRANVSAPMHSVAGNPMRFGGRDLTLRLDDAWRRRMRRRRRLLVTATTAPLLKAYGYPLR